MTLLFMYSGAGQQMVHSLQGLPRLLQQLLSSGGGGGSNGRYWGGGGGGGNWGGGGGGGGGSSSEWQHSMCLGMHLHLATTAAVCRSMLLPAELHMAALDRMQYSLSLDLPFVCR